MDDRHQVLHHLLLWAERLRVEHHDLAVMRLAQVRQQLEAETCQAIFVGDDQGRKLAANDPVNQFRELRPLEVQAAADL
ncbi:MAG: hypothetical protein A3K45_06650 [Chloroflexi bacterium RIFOXYC12_FULL_59_14]|nr:MAG: hypothetical protein A3K45_06650 [Chloroflexi bacterium RIFOXYC12_FULL_59_14]